MWLCAAHNISFLLNQFPAKYQFSFEFCDFTVKSPSVTQISVSQENAFKEELKPVAFFFRKIIGYNISFALIENNFRF